MIEAAGGEAVAGERRESPVEVDAGIAAVIGEASRPRGVPALVVPPDRIPGPVGLVRGLRLVIGNLLGRVRVSGVLRSGGE